MTSEGRGGREGGARRRSKGNLTGVAAALGRRPKPPVYWELEEVT